jgi:hypothetical protein
MCLNYIFKSLSGSPWSLNSSKTIPATYLGMSVVDGGAVLTQFANYMNSIAGNLSFTYDQATALIE